MKSEGWLKTKNYIGIAFEQEKVSVHIDENSGCCWVSKHVMKSNYICMYFRLFPLCILMVHCIVEIFKLIIIYAHITHT